MVSFTRKLIGLLPTMPRRRYTIFGGTNVLAEWRRMWHFWLFGEPSDTSDIVREYERKFAERCGARHAISFGAGRMALYAILEAMGIGEGDEVIIPAFTCVVVPNAILYRGARPVFVDIEARLFNIDVPQVEAAITPRTKALYAQHTFGVPCDVEALRVIGRRHGLPVIEDAAHALGAVYHGRPTGSLTEVAFFSTDHSKVINTYLGGMAVTSDDALAARLRELQARAPALAPQTVRQLVRSFLAEYVCFSAYAFWFGRTVHFLLARARWLFYFRDELMTVKPAVYPCRLSSAQAILGLSQLEALERNLAHRRRIASWLEQTVGWSGLNSDTLTDAAWLRYSFLVRDRAQFERAFRRHLDLEVWFTSVVAGRSSGLQLVGYEPGSCPVAEHVVAHIVNFPTHPRLPFDLIQKEVNRNWSWMRSAVLYDSKHPFDMASRTPKTVA